MFQKQWQTRKYCYYEKWLL